MTETWPSLVYQDWAATCDTLHAHTQLLGKIAAALGWPEPQLQHAALRLTARGWETPLLPAPDGSGAIVAALDLRRHRATVEHSNGRTGEVPLTPDRAVADVTREVVALLQDLAGPVTLTMTPQEVAWTTPLDRDTEHATYDVAAVERYFTAATQAALVLAEFRAPFRGRATPVNAWWGSFDLAVNLFSGRDAEPPSDDFIMRNAMDAQEVAIGWWPGDSKYGRAAFYAYAHPAADGFSHKSLVHEHGRWDQGLGEYVLDWEDIRHTDNPGALALDFAREVFGHACVVCAWDPTLAATGLGHARPTR